MVFNGKEGLECGVHVDGIRLDNVLEFKYLECFLNEYFDLELPVGVKSGM